MKRPTKPEIRRMKGEYANFLNNKFIVSYTGISTCKVHPFPSAECKVDRALVIFHPVKNIIKSQSLFSWFVDQILFRCPVFQEIIFYHLQ